MKKTITLLAFLIFGVSRSQTVSDFENFVLPTDSFYNDTTGADWQTTYASFQYDWVSSFGGYWSGGFAYTNKNNPDSGNYRHLYNCAAGKGYNLSDYYTTGQPGGFIRIKAPSTGVIGFYVTNSTYAYKSMKDGDAIGKKFGDTTGTGCLCPQGSIQDWFLLEVFGYSGGIQKTDTVKFYLADFRSNNNSLDYILKTWQWVNCNKLGAVDSIYFKLTSSDVGMWGMNTPAFFSIDNFTTGQGVGIAENSFHKTINLFPNPASEVTTINITSEKGFSGSISIYNSIGVLIKKEVVEFSTGETNHPIDVSKLNTGLYFVELTGGTKKQTLKLIRQ